MKSITHKVFVYGTLKPGGHYWPRFCEGKVTTAIPAKIHGELYDLHVGYPGLFIRGDSWVYGYVLTIPRDEDFEQLDVLEGYQPNRAEELNEYTRVQVECFDQVGASLGEVWVYEMTETTFRQSAGTRIEDGDWCVD